MGRHAQANRRGSATQGYTQYPPAEADWDVGEDGGQCFVTSLGSGPGGGVTAWEAEIYAVDAPGVINEFWSGPVDDTALSVNVFDEVRGIRIRWLAGSTPVSGWSAQKTVDFG